MHVPFAATSTSMLEQNKFRGVKSYLQLSITYIAYNIQVLYQLWPKKGKLHATHT